MRRRPDRYEQERVVTDQSEVAISHLQRRKIEGRVLIPFIQAVSEKFGEAAMHEVLDATIRSLAAEDGAAWAKAFGRTTASMRRVAEDVWAGGGGMDVHVVGENDDHLDFDVTRCGYAEFYRQLGLADLGYRIHCSRDHAMVAGFSDDLELSRSQTIMQGAACCDFRFRRKIPG
jgi:predicted ArsR family transcriptional regulator